MSFFGRIIRTAINVATLPVDVVKDAVTLGGSFTEDGRSSIAKKVQLIKNEAEDDA